MKRYKNASGDSGVTHFEIGGTYIRLRFSGSEKMYEYNHRLNGKAAVEKMKNLAEKGSGLSTYVAQHAGVRDNFKEIPIK